MKETNLKSPRSKDSSIWDCRSQISRFEARANREGGRLIRFAFNHFTKRAMNIQNTHPSVLLSRRGVASATSSLRAYLSSPLLSLFIYRQLFVSLLKAICFNLRLNEGQIIIIHINNNYRTIILIIQIFFLLTMKLKIMMM